MCQSATTDKIITANEAVSHRWPTIGSARYGRPQPDDETQGVSQRRPTHHSSLTGSATGGRPLGSARGVRQRRPTDPQSGQVQAADQGCQPEAADDMPQSEGGADGEARRSATSGKRRPTD
eukprot:3953885-Amphidinium_carterae.2